MTNQIVAHPASGFGLGVPDRLQNLHYVRVLHGGNRQRADDIVSIGFEGGAPLAGVLVALPSRFVRLDVSFRTLFEAHRLGEFDVAPPWNDPPAPMSRGQPLRSETVHRFDEVTA